MGTKYYMLNLFLQGLDSHPTPQTNTTPHHTTPHQVQVFKQAPNDLGLEDSLVDQ